MSKAFSFLCFCFFAVIGFRAWGLDWRPIADGLNYAKIGMVTDGSTVTVHALKVDLQKRSLKPIYTPARSFAKSMAIAWDALAVVNANFFEGSGKPLGLVVIDGKESNAFKNISWWSVLCFTPGKAEIVHSTTFESGRCQNALQAGPRLVIDGQAPKLKENIAKKSAVGLNAKGEFFIVTTEHILPMSQFADLLRLPEKDGGLGLTNALNLDGGSSAQIYVNTDSFTLDIPNFVQVPVGLGVF